MDKFTIIIPVYNEEELIKKSTLRLINFLDKKDYLYEILLVDNGSTDGTKEIGLGLSKQCKNVIFFSVTKNKAPGLAFKEGVLKARYENIISIDMDLSVELEFVEKAVELLRRYDIVIGSKITGEQKRSFFRKLPSFVYIQLVKMLLGLSFSDYSMAAKGYKRDIILKCLDRIDKGSSYVIEIIYFAKKNGKKLIEVPVACNDKRKSKFNIFNESWYRLWNLI